MFGAQGGEGCYPQSVMHDRDQDEGRDRKQQDHARAGWQPTLGAWPEREGVRFRVWAPGHERVELVLEGQGAARSLVREGEGYWETEVPDVGPGALYRYRLDGDGPFPDPASRFQPRGVHGASAVIDPGAFPWTDGNWTGVRLEELVVYELHVGTFTSGGTFGAAREKLAELKHLGVTAIELMPVADFPGRWNWGYDGVDLFAPARAYGEPDDLRHLVDAAHAIGLGVLLDVVYNHLGPDGNYLGLFSPRYFSEVHETPWGGAVNLDGPASEHVRGFLIENALHWIHEYHLDGLRLDACHALVDDSPRHFLAELQERVRSSVRGREVLVIAEDSRNLVRMVQPEDEGGYGLDGVWADDLHHQIRVGLAGDRDGYYADFTGSFEDLAGTIRDGWFYQGQTSRHFGGPRGTDPTPAPPRRFVVCVQNHDQVGNRALGERLHHQVDLAAWRAACALLLLVPETPLLFMGQEWGATSPFLFFTDHNPDLGRLVTEGRRKEFADFRAFADPAARALIPDPQAEETFRRSRLDWDERDREPHAGLWRLTRDLLAARRSVRLGTLSRDQYGVAALPERGVVLLIDAGGEADERLLVVACLESPGPMGLDEVAGALGLEAGASWQPILSTEDGDYAPDPRPVEVEGGPIPRIRFARPGTLVLRAGPLR